MNLRTFSGIGRPLDFAWPTNVAIFLVTIAVGILSAASGIWNGLPPAEMAWPAVRTAGNVFLAWALCREIDPDHQRTAFVASAAVLLWAVFKEDPPLLPGLWLIMATRFLNRSTGIKPTPLDWLGFIGLGLWLAYDLSATFIPLDPSRPLLAAGIALALSLAFLPVYKASESVMSVGDDTGTPLSPRAVQRSQVFILALGLLLAVVFGMDGVAWYAPAWAAVLGASTSLGRRPQRVGRP